MVYAQLGEELEKDVKAAFCHCDWIIGAELFPRPVFRGASKWIRSFAAHSVPKGQGETEPRLHWAPENLFIGVEIFIAKGVFRIGAFVQNWALDKELGGYVRGRTGFVCTCLRDDASDSTRQTEEKDCEEPHCAGSLVCDHCILVDNHQCNASKGENSIIFLSAEPKREMKMHCLDLVFKF